MEYLFGVLYGIIYKTELSKKIFEYAKEITQSQTADRQKEQ